MSSKNNDPLAAIEAKIQAALSGAASGGTKKRTPIGGLPADYSVSYRVPYTGQGGAAGQVAAGGGNPAAAYGPNASVLQTQGIQYFNGDEWSQAPTNPQDIVTVQQALVQTGLLDPGGLVYGSWDPKTATGFAKLLAMANHDGTDWKSTLAARMAAAGAEGAAPKQNDLPPLTISLTNPDDIKAAANNVAKQLHGTYLDPGQLQAFTDAFHSQETAAQTAAYNQQYDPNRVTASGNLGGYGAGGTSTAAPSSAGMEEQIAQKIRDEKPQELASNTFVSNLGTMLSALTQNSAGPRMTR